MARGSPRFPFWLKELVSIYGRRIVDEIGGGRKIESVLLTCGRYRDREGAASARKAAPDRSRY
jgi:hypothetical protein